jgi:hypothetical protein
MIFFMGERYRRNDLDRIVSKLMGALMYRAIAYTVNMMDEL